ncbi:ABC transporter ATP-binding protein [Candidatus Daviesbacteria bacterium]|nr:ABC transporter ATP-binding protein [Candidatus Daviesbacteria bacterium]
MEFVKKVWKLLNPFHKRLYFIFFITVIFEAVRLTGPYLFGKILDLLVATKGLITIETAIVVLAGLGGVRVISLVIDHLADWIILNFLIKTERFISTSAYKKMIDLSLDYHEKIPTGKKITLLNKGTDKLIELVNHFTFEFQPTVLQLLVTAVLIFLTNIKIGLIYSLSLIPFVLITFHIFKSTQKLREDRHEAYELSSSEIGDTMSNISVVKGFAQENRENESFGMLRKYISDVSLEEFRKRVFTSFSRNILIEVFYIFILIIGLFEVRANALTIGSLVFLISLTERAYSNIFRLGRIYVRISEAREPVDRLSELIDAKPSVENSPNPIFVDIKGEIKFQNVSFAYSKRNVLKNVSFRVPAGSFTALVGKSGSGKSTIAKLLSRYYDPQQGKVLIDGYDLKMLDLETYRKQTAVVFQDAPVPNRKIYQVISYAAGDKPYEVVNEQVIEASKLAYAHEFIMEFEDGYLTEIGERGVKLSGGQRQRLAIARSLFEKPKILIMDEPTSHLDTISESLIQKALENLSKERLMTKIIIAHRLSTVQRADQILVMEKGKLVEMGTHDELVKKDGIYSQIVKQSELKK